jgi:hypothetical protein
MSGNYSNASDMAAPARGAFSIVPSNDLLQIQTRAIYVGGDGNLTVVTDFGNQVTFVGLVAGTILPVACKKVLSSSTATNLVGLF